VLLVQRIAQSQRFRNLREDVRQQAIMQMHHRLAPILARPHQPDGNAIRIGVGVELRVPAEAADVGLVGEIDGDLRLV
jgi:hypothetical protein